MRDQSVRESDGTYAVMPLAGRFEAQYEPEPTSGCWIWIGVVDRLGYGAMEIDGRKAMAHRVSHILSKGDIPPGLTIDHLCRNRRCVNPAHLEAVPHRVNVLRGHGIAAKRATQTHCVNGHEFTPENTYLYRGRYRSCRDCGNRRNREFRARQTASH